MLIFQLFNSSDNRYIHFNDGVDDKQCECNKYFANNNVVAKEFSRKRKRNELQAPAKTSGGDINSFLAAMMEKMQVLTEVQEASRTENQKVQEANKKLYVEIQEYFRAENQKLLSESRKVSEQKMKNTQAAILSKIEKKLEGTL